MKWQKWRLKLLLNGCRREVIARQGAGTTFARWEFSDLSSTNLRFFWWWFDLNWETNGTSFLGVLNGVFVVDDPASLQSQFAIMPETNRTFHVAASNPKFRQKKLNAQNHCSFSEKVIIHFPSIFRPAFNDEKAHFSLYFRALNLCKSEKKIKEKQKNQNELIIFKCVLCALIIWLFASENERKNWVFPFRFFHHLFVRGLLQLFLFNFENLFLPLRAEKLLNAKLKRGRNEEVSVEWIERVARLGGNLWLSFRLRRRKTET